MANRPRRPKAGIGASEPDTAEPKTPSTSTDGPDFPPDAGGPIDRPTEGRESDLAASAPLPGEPAASSTGAGLPPLEEQPAASPEAIEQQRGGEDTRAKAATSDQLAAEGAAEDSSVETFAREEGLGAKAGEAPRRHLGEFEDDETLAANEPHEATTRTVTDAYRDGDAAHAEGRSAAGPSTSSLVGAGLAGAVLALLGGSLLVYGGLVPGAGQSGTPGQYASTGDVEAVSSELATVRESVAQLQSAEAAGGSGTNFAPAADLAALSDRVTAAEQALQDQPGVDTGALEESTAGAQETATAAQDAATAAQDAANAAQTRADEAQSLATQTDERVGALQARLDELEAAQSQARLALAAANLKAAIDRGGSFEPELEGFAAAGADEGAVEPLRPFATQGVPTQSALMADWPQAEADIRRAFIQPDASANVGDQLLAGLSSLVTVRSTGENAGAEGDPNEAVLSRMREALASGDLAGWLSAHETLDEAARNASEPFAERVEARRQASTIVDSALAEATGATPAREG